MSDDALANVYDAGAMKLPGWLALVTALAAARPEGIGATIDWLVANRDALERAHAAGGTKKLAAAVVPSAMQFTPELGYLDRAADDNIVRGRSLFHDLVGTYTLTQITVFAITGLEITARDGELLDELAAINLTLDRRAWPMAVTRRVGAGGGGFAPAALAGVAMMSAPILAGAAAADCARFLVAARSQPRDAVAEVLAARRRVMGFGRPVVGPDERVPQMLAALRRHDRDDLPYARVMREVEAAFREGKGLAATSAGWVAAILLDFGMTPHQVEAVSSVWVANNVWAQAAFSAEPRGPM